MNGISAIVVSRGLSALLRQCVTALFRALDECGLQARELILVDNASELPYAQEDFPEARLIRFDHSQSFARANNEAARRSSCEYILLLNNDVLLNERALRSPVDLMNSVPGAGICGLRLLFPDGTIQHCGTVFGAGDTGPYHVDRRRPGHLVPRASVERQAVTGACMLIRRTLWDELGGLDESYPFGLEDVDFCLRARQRGWNIFCCNDVDSLHFESMTPGRSDLDIPSRRLFLQRWKGHYTIDG